MATFLSIALLLVGSLATLSAFGGETWAKGSEPILERITRRGWISLICLLVTLGLGVTKQLKSNADDKTSKAVSDAAEQAAKDREQGLHDQLVSTRGDLNVALERIKGLSGQNDTNLARLKDAKDTIDDVRTNLDATRDDLSQQSKASFLTALANSNQTIADIFIAIPFTASAKQTIEPRLALLPPLSVNACQDLIEITIEVDLPDNNQTVYIEPGDTASSHTYFSQPVPEADSVADLNNDFDLAGLKKDVKQTSVNGYGYEIEIRPVDQHIAAAAYYSDLTDRDVPIITIRATWPPSFQTKDMFDTYNKKYPGFLPPWRSYYMLAGRYVTQNRMNYPQSCMTQVRSYFGRAFQKAAVIVKLQGDENEDVGFRLKASPPTSSALAGIGNVGDIKIEFHPEATPKVTAGEDVGGIDAVKWPLPKPAKK